jgi:hypothetical protein
MDGTKATAEAAGPTRGIQVYMAEENIKSADQLMGYNPVTGVAPVRL